MRVWAFLIWLCAAASVAAVSSDDLTDGSVLHILTYIREFNEVYPEVHWESRYECDAQDRCELQLQMRAKDGVPRERIERLRELFVEMLNE